MRSFLLGLLAASALLACQPEQVPVTQTVVRIDAAPNVRAAMHKLRVRTSAPRADAWEKRNDKYFTLDQLSWPVDIVVTPRAESEADKQFDLIADALDAHDATLVQARVLTGFVRRQQRILFVTLSACASVPLGTLCEPNPDCFGPTCLTCVDGRCAATPVASPDTLSPFTPGEGMDRGDAALDGSGDEGGVATTLPDAGEPGGNPDGGVDAGMDGGGTPFDAGPGVTCDPGSERNGAGVCVDIDECARGTDDCDHEPQACSNTAAGFACACPTGYRGLARGPNGCADIDECAEQIDSCDALVTCNNTPGGYSCGGCPSGYAPGAGGACADIDECPTNNGGCDTSPMAICSNRVGMANICSCPSGYTGNGVGMNGCTDADECMSNNGGCDTSPMATCMNRVGLANTCACPTGYSGNGVGASGCVDPCSPNPCGTGLTCARSATATAVCSASCAAAGAGGCQAGDTCVTDADCRTGGDSSATCDATAKVCVTVCAATTITEPIHLTRARFCKEITGNLTFNPTFATVATTDLPYLTRVRGSLHMGSGTAVNSVTQTITLNNLQTIDGGIVGTYMTALTRLSLPRLATLGGSFTVTFLTAATQMSVPQLRSVGGDWYFAGLNALTQLDIGTLQTITGMVTLQQICRLPSTQVARITATGSGSPFISSVGCCTSSLTQLECPSGACTCN